MKHFSPTGLVDTRKREMAVLGASLHLAVIFVHNQTGSKMASACALEWAPDSLYNTAISTIVSYYSAHKRELKTLPENVQFDIYYKVRADWLNAVIFDWKLFCINRVLCLSTNMKLKTTGWLTNHLIMLSAILLHQLACYHLVWEMWCSQDVALVHRKNSLVAQVKFHWFSYRQQGVTLRFLRTNEICTCPDDLLTSWQWFIDNAHHLKKCILYSIALPLRQAFHRPRHLELQSSDTRCQSIDDYRKTPFWLTPKLSVHIFPFKHFCLDKFQRK